MTKYRLIFDCVNNESCQAIQYEMKSLKFTRITPVTTSLLGDHQGYKEFTSLSSAKRFAKSFLENHKEMMYHIIVV